MSLAPAALAPAALAAMALAAFIAGLLVILAWNLVLLRSRRIARIPDEALPFVSMLVPARDEEANIERCVASLQAQDYPRFDIHVLDDGSADGTAGIVERLAEHDGRVTLHRGAPLPAGWAGKNHACHQLSEHARGEWLLFTDADTVHAPHALRAAVEAAMTARADLLTQIPRQIMGSAGEKLVVPLLHFVSLVLLPVYFTHHARGGRYAIGVGQFLLFRRDAYRRIGGHAALRGALVEDVWLARRVKTEGLRLRLRAATGDVTCRMYRGWGEVWRGFSKNIYAGLGFSPVALAAAIAALFLLFVAPPICLAAALCAGASTALMLPLAAAVVLPIVMRLILALRFRLGIPSAFFHGVGVLLLIAIAVNSWRWMHRAGGAQWKGRTYTLSALSPSATETRTP
jgi:chlorobactene glucosyltransferase